MTGECAVCAGTYTLRSDGNVRAHNRCPGSQAAPERSRTREPVPASPHLMTTGFGVSLGWAS